MVHRSIVEGEEADQLLQKPSTADIRELNGTTQNLQYRKPWTQNVYRQNPGTAGENNSYRFQMSIKGMQAVLQQANIPQIHKSDEKEEPWHRQDK